jgi:hypothetical protein
MGLHGQAAHRQQHTWRDDGRRQVVLHRVLLDPLLNLGQQLPQLPPFALGAPPRVQPLPQHPRRLFKVQPDLLLLVLDQRDRGRGDLVVKVRQLTVVGR